MRPDQSATVDCVVQRAFPGLPGIADHSGRAAGQHDRPVAGLLEPTQRQQRDEVAGVQTRRGRVEPRIDGDGSRGQLVSPAQSRSVDCAISPRHSNSSRMFDVPMDSIFPYQSLWPGAGARGLRRYSDTSGRPASQNRHGRSAAWLTPTRGPSADARSSASAELDRAVGIEKVDPVVVHRDSQRRAEVARAAGQRGRAHRVAAAMPALSQVRTRPPRPAAAPRRRHRRSRRRRWRRRECRGCGRCTSGPAGRT